MAARAGRVDQGGTHRSADRDSQPKSRSGQDGALRIVAASLGAGALVLGVLTVRNYVRSKRRDTRQALAWVTVGLVVVVLACLAQAANRLTDQVGPLLFAAFVTLVVGITRLLAQRARPRTRS
jgi:FtsH-binding integral membrane protein